MKSPLRISALIRTTTMTAVLVVPLSAPAYVTVEQAVNVGPPINGPTDDFLSDMSDDGLSLIFTRADFGALPDPQTDGDLWIATRPTTSDAWSDPVPLPGPVNSPAFEASPTVTGNGLELYFTDGIGPRDVPMRPGGVGLRDIWVATRSRVDEEFGVPMNLGPTVNSPFQDGAPEISSDGRELYISSRRGDGVTNEIWVTTRTDVTDPLGWGPPVKLGTNVNSGTGDAAPSLSADGRTMFFVSLQVRPADLWMTTRENASDLFGWAPAVRLGSAVNSPESDISPDISADGSTLLFSSNRPSGDKNDIYQAAITPVTNLAMDVSPTASYTVVDDDRDATFDNLGDAATDTLSRQRSAVGEFDTEAGNRVVRAVVKFQLPLLLPEPGESFPGLKSATLRLFLEDIDGAPAGPVSLFHSLTDNDSDVLPEDYENTTYTDTLLDLVAPGDPAGQYYELDVTDWVRADYGTNYTDGFSAFRLQINEAEFFEDDQSARYRFAMPGNEDHRPELVLSFVPEPPAWVLLVLGAFGLCASPGVRRRLWFVFS